MESGSRGGSGQGCLQHPPVLGLLALILEHTTVLSKQSTELPVPSETASPDFGVWIPGVERPSPVVGFSRAGPTSPCPSRPLWSVSTKGGAGHGNILGKWA